MIINKKVDPEEIVDFSDFWFNFKPYPYQKEFLNLCLTHNRIAGKWCRQSGKSQSVSVYVLYKSVTDVVSTIIIAPTQNQSSVLFKKIRDLSNANPQIRATIKKSTATEMVFNNGSRIVALPSGPEGKTIRGYTADIIVQEEAGIMKDEIVNTVITPMIASKGEFGQIIKIGTPLRRNHFYRSCFEDDDYKVVNVTWKQCIEEGQYTQKFIDEQRAQCTDIEFRTEYEAEFIDDAMSFFPASLIDNCKEEYNLIPRL